MPNDECAPHSFAIKRMSFLFVWAQLVLIGPPVLGASLPASVASKNSPELVDLQTHSKRFEQFAQNHEVGRLGVFYAANAWMKPACSPFIQGHAQVLEAWKELFARRQFSPTFKTRDFDVSPDGKIAVERGRAQFLENVGGVPYGSNFEYTRIWNKVGRRDWHIAADIALAADTCDDDEE